MHCNASHMTLEGCNFKGGHYKSFFFLWTPKKRILAEKMFFWTRIENLEWKSSTKPLKIGRNSHPLNADYGHYIQNAKSASKFKQWCGDSEFELHVKFQVKFWDQDTSFSKGSKLHIAFSWRCLEVSFERSKTPV